MILQKKSILGLIFTILLVFSVKAVNASTPGYIYKKVGKTGTGPGEFDMPESIVLMNNQYYVSEVGNNRIQVFDLNWNFIKQFGGDGNGLGQLKFPYDMTTNGTHLFVSEFGNHRISIFDSEGNFISEFGDSALISPTGITLYDGEIYVADYYGYYVDVFNGSTFTVSRSFGNNTYGNTYYSENGIIVDGIYYLCDGWNNTIMTYNAKTGVYLGHFGKSVTDGGHLGTPYSIKYRNGYFVVSNQWSGDIAVFNKIGNFVDEFRFNDLRSPAGFELTNQYLVEPDALTDTIYSLKLVADPVNVVARAGQTSTDISWQIDNSNGITNAEKFMVYRDNGDGMDFIGSTENQKFTDNSAITGVNYTYGIKAISYLGNSALVSSNSVHLYNNYITTSTEAANTSSNANSGFFSSLPLSITPVIAVLMLIPILLKYGKRE